MQKNDSHGLPQPPGAQQVPPNGGYESTMWNWLPTPAAPSYTNAVLTVIAVCLAVLTILEMRVTSVQSGYVTVYDREQYDSYACGGKIGRVKPCRVEVINWPSREPIKAKDDSATKGTNRIFIAPK